MNGISPGDALFFIGTLLAYGVRVYMGWLCVTEPEMTPTQKR
jgi:hypothetical protein